MRIITNIQHTDNHLSHATPNNINVEIENDLNLNYVVAEGVESGNTLPDFDTWLEALLGDHHGAGDGREQCDGEGDGGQG